MNVKHDKPVGRFAPTPSGRLHLGNVFTAMLAYLSAKSKGGECLLRIEDLDRERCPKNAVETLLDDLEWFGFEFSGEILYQSERSEIYMRELDKLDRAGLTYPCYCSRARLAATAPHGATPVYDGKCKHLSPELRPDKPPSTRVTVPDVSVSFTDGVKGEYRQNLTTECGDFIVRRADGVCSYQLAVVTDDALSNVTEVVRGSDLIFSTPRQIYLYETLGYKTPKFYHTPLILTRNGERLSKRDGSSNLDYTRARFHDPKPVIGLLAANAGIIDAFEPITLNELITIFKWDKIKKSDIRLNTFGLLD